MAEPLANHTQEQLDGIVTHTNVVFGELADELDSDADMTDALRVLLQSDTTVEDFVVLMTAQPQLGEKILMSSLSALVNAHSLTTVRKEIARRTDQG